MPLRREKHERHTPMGANASAAVAAAGARVDGPGASPPPARPPAAPFLCVLGSGWVGVESLARLSAGVLTPVALEEASESPLDCA